MSVTKVSVIGHFGFGCDCMNGQTIKTKMVTQELRDTLGESEVNCYDTHGRWRFLMRAPFLIFSAVKHARNVLIFPAYKGVLVITPLLVLFNLLFHRSLHYVVIGGWLPAYLRRFPLLRYCLHTFFDGVYVETNTMREQIEEIGMRNVFLMPNFKKLDVLSLTEVEGFSRTFESGKAIALCTFSRVMKEKGIGDAVEAVRQANDLLHREAFTLDIYGPVWPTQQGWFDDLCSSFPTSVRYRGTIEYNKSVGVLKDYFALLFPTYYEGEGVAGTFIDSFAAGLPCIASDWHDNARIVRQGVTGLIFPPKDVDALVRILLDIAENPTLLMTMRKDCILEAKSFLPQSVMPILTDRLA